MPLAEMDQGADAVGVAHVVQLFFQDATDEEVARKERFEDPDDAATGVVVQRANAGRRSRGRPAGRGWRRRCVRAWAWCARNTSRAVSLKVQHAVCVCVLFCLPAQIHGRLHYVGALFLVSRGPPSFFCHATIDCLSRRTLRRSRKTLRGAGRRLVNGQFYARMSEIVAGMEVSELGCLISRMRT